MPTYVYKFTDTGETIEVQQAFTDDALTEAVHPRSGATMQVKKVFLPVGVTFRGGGFYKTDSKSSSDKSSSDKSSSDKSSPDKSSSDKAPTDKTSTEKSSSSADGNGSSKKSETASTPAPASSANKD